MKNCILCNIPTKGSVGAAGLRWSIICQSCKDREDETLAKLIKYQAKIYNNLEDALITKEVA